MGAICFTSSGRNGGCWVVLVFPRPFLEKRVFFPYTIYAKKKFTRLTPKIKFRRKKPGVTGAKKKSYASYAPPPPRKSEVCLFPQSSYAFLTWE